jgi:putative ABC transport system permease protein
VHLSGVWMQRDELTRWYPQAQGFYLFRLHEDVDVVQAAGDVERALRGVGMQVTSVEEDAAEIQQEAERVYVLLSGYLGLGLVVGVASLGIVTARAVLERRRETGMLRAVGYTPGRVTAVLLVEALYLLGVSLILGVTLGLLVARAVFEAEIATLPGTSFVVPWVRLGVLMTVAVVATALAVVVPALRAGRTPPSAALRRVD